MGKRKSFLGRVLSAKMQKTIVVRVTRITKHPKYGRTKKYSTTFKVHDEEGQARSGDTVRIEETRPLSKDKHFRLVKVIEKAAFTHEVKDGA